MTDNQSEAKKWIDDAEDGLNRTLEALRKAWDETRDARMSTLEAAKEAAARLGTAIDLGIEAARHSWDRENAEAPSSGTAEAADELDLSTEEE